jgi:hypothetical protein
MKPANRVGILIEVSGYYCKFSEWDIPSCSRHEHLQMLILPENPAALSNKAWEISDVLLKMEIDRVSI